MTRYEERVAAKEIPPLTSMDMLFIQATVDNIVKGTEILDEDLYEILIGLTDEIDYLYLEHQDTLAAFRKHMDMFKKKADTIIEHPVVSLKVKEAEEYSDKFGKLPPGWQERLNTLLHNNPEK